jgi:hypothetical protein
MTTYKEDLIVRLKKVLEDDLHASYKKLSPLREEAISKIGKAAWEKLYYKARIEVVKDLDERDDK